MPQADSPAHTGSARGAGDAGGRSGSARGAGDAGGRSESARGAGGRSGPAAPTGGRSGAHGGPLTVVAIFGPTGIGKTTVAIALAERLRAGGEDPVAIAADALQVYAGLETLTAAPTAAERARLEHRLVGVLPVTETFSAGAYARRAHAEIDAALADGRRVLVVGGTGLYLRAALAELDLRPPAAPEARARLHAQLRSEGPAALHAELERRAPATAEALAPTDSQRLVRALELLDAGHPPPPAPGAPSQLWTTETRHPTVLAGLAADRGALRERIDRRVDAMVAAGAAEEARRAVAQGASPTARKALGFRELLDGDVEAMKARTRRYAKRQLTWMRKLPGIRLIDVTGRAPDEVAAEIHAMIPDRCGSRSGRRSATTT